MCWLSKDCRSAKSKKAAACRKSVPLILLLFSLQTVYSQDSLHLHSEKLTSIASSIQGVLHDIVKGNNKGNTTDWLDLESYIVDDKYTERIQGVDNLVEGEQTELFFYKLVVDEDFTTVLAVFKTIESSNKKIEKLHTVFFTKSDSLSWKIKSWHTSQH